MNPIPALTWWRHKMCGGKSSFFFFLFILKLSPGGRRPHFSWAHRDPRHAGGIGHAAPGERCAGNRTHARLQHRALHQPVHCTLQLIPSYTGPVLNMSVNVTSVWSFPGTCSRVFGPVHAGVHTPQRSSRDVRPRPHEQQQQLHEQRRPGKTTTSDKCCASVYKSSTYLNDEMYTSCRSHTIHRVCGVSDPVCWIRSWTGFRLAVYSRLWLKIYCSA